MQADKSIRIRNRPPKGRQPQHSFFLDAPMCNEINDMTWEQRAEMNEVLDAVYRDQDERDSVRLYSRFPDKT
jgi:hypothetical protein